MQLEKREKNILKNSIIFTIGSLGTKLFSYIMVLVYSHYIDSADLGYFDVVLTTISLLMPVVLLSFDEGIYRWLIECKQDDSRRIISTCIKTISITTLFAIFIFFVFNLNFVLEYSIWIIFMFATSLYYQLLQNAVRGLSKNKLYAASGIFNSIFLLLFEVIGIIIFNQGILGLIWAKTFANIVTIILLYNRVSDFHGVIKEKLDKNLSKNIARYTIPLIPNSISWWVVNFSDRYIVLFFLGSSFNGIYSISNKFPAIVSTIAGILYFAFQEAIIKEYNSSDRDDFYSSIFEKYYKFLFAVILCGMPITKIIIIHFVGPEYQSAWLYTEFLFVGTVFSALSSFLGIGYQVSKETKRSLNTTLIAAIINIGINILMINKFGLHAASFSTLASYIILFIIRIIHSKRYFCIKIRLKVILPIIIICMSCMLATYFGNELICFVQFVLFCLVFFVLNKEIIFTICENLFKMKNG